MIKPTSWGKIAAIASGAVAIVGVLALPVKFIDWQDSRYANSDDINQLYWTHQHDFFSIRQELAEDKLLPLLLKQSSAENLTAIENRKAEDLLTDIDRYRDGAANALSKLQIKDAKDD